jgi:hypothetical protein
VLEIVIPQHAPIEQDLELLESVRSGPLHTVLLDWSQDLIVPVTGVLHRRVTAIITVSLVAELPVKRFARTPLAVVEGKGWRFAVLRCCISRPSGASLTISSQESHKRIELSHTVLQGCTRQTPPVAWIQGKSSLGSVCRPLFDVVGLVQDDTTTGQWDKQAELNRCLFCLYSPVPLDSMHRALFLDHCITSLESLLLFSERCLESTVRDHDLKEGRSEPALKAAEFTAGFAYHIEFL